MTKEPPRSTHAAEVLQTLKEIRDELRELRENFNTFSNEGMPLRTTVPTPELIATMAATTAVLLRDGPIDDLEQRLNASQMIGDLAIKHHDEFCDFNQVARLEEAM